MTTVHTIPAVNNAVTTVTHKASYNFRNWKQDSDGFKRLSALIDGEKITLEDIAVTKDKEGKEENDLYQRKPVVLELEVPLVSSFIKDSTLTPLQLDHLQALLNQAIEKAQQPAVDAGTITPEELTPWYSVFDAPFKQRTAAVKITEDMLKAAVALFAEFLTEAGSSEKGIALISNLSLKKFALTACVKVKRTVLDKIQGRIVEWVDSMKDEDQHTHAAVLNLFATNLEKALNPEAEDEVDEDMI